MLTRLIVRNFKRFDEAEIDLGETVVFIGPNNSGKTTALQALALWDIGMRRWVERRGRKQGGAASSAAKERAGVTISRRDLIAVPVPDANLLWRDLHTRDVQRENGSQRTKNVRIEILVEGVTKSERWQCGFEFDYANDESFYCRPLRLTDEEPIERLAVPDEIEKEARVAFLPPMSGLADREFIKQPGEMNFLIGQGRTAEVLRNLCYRLSEENPGAWQSVRQRIQQLFGVELNQPKHLLERSEITLSYRDRSKVLLDLSSSGRGLQQTLLLLAYLAANPKSVLLLDEPDAHLEVLRQRQIYQVLTEAARQQESQVIAASHSEVILNEAAERDTVVAFLGKPHRIDNRGNQLVKALKEIGFEQYYQAEQRGWVLYLEGSTDLAILQALAETLQHPVREVLERPFVHYVKNQPSEADRHFYGLREACPTLLGYALFDRLDKQLASTDFFVKRMWRRRELENYLCAPQVLLAWARGVEHRDNDNGTLFDWETPMQQTIEEIASALRTLGEDPWSPDIKATDQFLDPLFRKFFERLQLPNLFDKTDYHQLARYLPAAEIAPEVTEAFDEILQLASQAQPASGASS